mmetsp:Transcript_41591/g.98630  ORF Transcript_41591/g.98630 Transcript_41591/m.98630 type:complete len:379 (+) Transcript_41591:3157-4293(+)
MSRTMKAGAWTLSGSASRMTAPKMAMFSEPTPVASVSLPSWSYVVSRSTRALSLTMRTGAIGMPLAKISMSGDGCASTGFLRRNENTARPAPWSTTRIVSSLASSPRNVTLLNCEPLTLCSSTSGGGMPISGRGRHAPSSPAIVMLVMQCTVGPARGTLVWSVTVISLEAPGHGVACPIDITVNSATRTTRMSSGCVATFSVIPHTAVESRSTVMLRRAFGSAGLMSENLRNIFSMGFWRVSNCKCTSPDACEKFAFAITFPITAMGPSWVRESRKPLSLRRVPAGIGTLSCSSIVISFSWQGRSVLWFTAVMTQAAQRSLSGSDSASAASESGGLRSDLSRRVSASIGAKHSALESTVTAPCGLSQHPGFFTPNFIV